MRLIATISSEKPAFGNFMLFRKHPNHTEDSLGVLKGHGTLLEMRELALVFSVSVSMKELKILDRMKGVWIEPQPLFDKVNKKEEYGDRGNEYSFVTDYWQDIFK